ncbi:hypothetical protein GF374_01170 [Candidatus Woesearchaeota archaeon]|nr:hypothetical protein [Candidatus Woesearchaeota archaeon]
MKQRVYVMLNVFFLVILAITFYFQVQAFKNGDWYQWLILVIIGIIGAISYYLNKKMKKEKWYKKLLKRKSRERSKKSR